MKTNYRIIVVAGPTASGKSDFAVALALSKSKGIAPFIDGEIISADSRQIYKGLDIGTGKITREEMKGIPHHMLDVCDLTDDFSVSEYKRLALPILEDILARGKTPIICGGTGQYIDALIFDQELPHVEPNKKLRGKLEKKSTEELVARLEASDPARASAIDIHNRPRLIRALEIVESLGFVPKQNTPILRYQTEFYLMSPTRGLIRERITRRLEKRLAIGMIEEVSSILERGYTSTTVKKFGLEYVAIAKYLEEDPTSLESSEGQRMKEEIITKSMQYVKRQDTWNKKYLPFATIVEVKE